MIALPNECFFEIFNNLQADNNSLSSLFSCLLVNRQWCRIIVPILWNKANSHFRNIKLIRTLLLALNAEEQALLIPFKINLPKYPKLLFEYTSYIRSIDFYLYDGIKNWLFLNRHGTSSELEYAVKRSLVAMLLRSSKRLKHLSLKGAICDQLIFKKLCENTTIFSMKYIVHDDFKYKAIEVLVKIFYKNNAILTSLDLSGNAIGSEGGKALAEALCYNTTLTSLFLGNNKFDSECGKALANALCKNTTLTSLNLSGNQLGFEGEKAIADALCKNTTLTSLNLSGNQLGSEGGKAIAETLYKNTTLAFLDLSDNQLRFEGGKALAEALCYNVALTYLDLSRNQLFSNVGNAMAEALCDNNTLTSLYLEYNEIDSRCWKAIDEALRKNKSLTS